jgi:hypothetical protein
MSLRRRICSSGPVEISTMMSAGVSDVGAVLGLLQPQIG